MRLLHPLLPFGVRAQEEGRGGERVADRGAWYQTYLIKELVLGQVPDVLCLIHRRKNSGHTESPLVLTTSSTWSCPSPQQPPRSPSCKAQVGCGRWTLGTPPQRSWLSSNDSVDVRKVPPGFPENLCLATPCSTPTFQQTSLRVYKTPDPVLSTGHSQM